MSASAPPLLHFNSKEGIWSLLTKKYTKKKEKLI